MARNRKSERLEKRTKPCPSPSPSLAAKQKQKQQQKKKKKTKTKTKTKITLPAPLRRSERNNKKPSSSKQLVTKKVSEDSSQVKLKRKRRDSRMYRTIFKNPNRVSDCNEESNKMDVDRSTPEGGGKIDECFKGSGLDCKQVSKDDALPSQESRLSGPVKELLVLENNVMLASSPPSNAATHHTAGAPRRVQSDCCAEETLQMLVSRNSISNESLIRNCVGHDKGQKLISSKRKGTMVDVHSDVSAALVDDHNSNLIADTGPSRLNGNTVGTSRSSSKRIRRMQITFPYVQRDQRKLINNVDQPSSKSECEKLSAGNEEGKSGDPVERPRANNDEFEKIRKQQRSLHLLLKPEIAKLCEILNLPVNVKSMVDNCLEYIMNNRQICTKPVSILQAFQLSLCWTAAALLKHKLDRKDSLLLAKQHLNFDCKIEEVNKIRGMMRKLKENLLYHAGNYNVSISPDASESSNRIYSKTGVSPKVELASKDISKSVKEGKLLLMQQEKEKKSLTADIEKEKADFVRRYKIEWAAIQSFSPDDVMRTQKLKVFNSEYDKRIEELKRQHETRLKDLEAKQLEARRKLQESWPPHALLNLAASKKLGTGVEYLPICDQEQPHNGLVSDGAICDGETSDVPSGEVALAVHKSSSSNDDQEEVPSCRQGKLDGTTLSKPVCGCIKVNRFSDGVKNMVSWNSQSPEEHIPSLTTMSLPNCKNAAQIHEADDSNGSNNADTLNSPLSDERIASLNSKSPQEHVCSVNAMCTPNCENSAQIYEADDGNGSNTSDNSVTLNSSLTDERIADGTIVSVLDREVHVASSPSNGPATVSLLNPPSLKQQIPDGVSLSIPGGQIPAIVPETSLELAECQLAYSVVVDKSTTSDQQEGVRRTMMENTLSQETAVSRPVDLMEPLEQVQPLSSVESPPDQDTAREKQNSLVSSLDDIVPVNQSNHVSLVMEPPEQVQQLPSAEFLSSNQDLSNLPLATGIEPQPTNEDPLSSPIPEASIEVPNQAVEQPASNLELDSPMPDGVRTHSSDTRSLSTPSQINNQPIPTATQLTAMIVPPLCHDPLNNELERIRQLAEQNMKNHEDMKLQLKSDFEKELEELRRKYEIKDQKIEVEFQQTMKNLDARRNTVLVNKFLAVAFRSNCVDIKGSGASGMQDASFAQQLFQHSRQQNATWPLVAGPSSCGPPAASLQSSYTTTSSQNMVPPIQATHSTSGIFSSVSARLPNVNSISSPSGNLQAGGEMRAPAPHLQPYRPSTSVPTSSFGTVPHRMPSQPASGNISVTSSSFSHRLSQPTPTTYQFDPHRGHWPVSVGVPTPNLPAMDLRMDANSQSGINLPNVASLNLSRFGTSSSTPANPAHQATSDVVCLSDDD